MDHRTTLSPTLASLSGQPATEAQPRDPCSSPLDFAPVTLAPRSDGWTPEKQRAFIEELADCGIVREAAARVGMTEQSARRLRRRPDAAAFNLAWDAAVRVGADRLHSIAYERAVNGTIRRRYFHGEVVGEELVFDNRLLIYLLGRTGKPAEASGTIHIIENWGAWMNAVEDGLLKPVSAPDESHRSPVWRGEDGLWLTNFPPPDDFEGRQWNGYGDENYCRELSAREQEAIQAWETRTQDQDGRRRDAYFNRLT